MKKLLLMMLLIVGGVNAASAWTTIKLLNSKEGKWDPSASTEMIDVGDGTTNFFYYILDSSTLTDNNYYFRIYCVDDKKYYGAYEKDNDYPILDVTNYGGCESIYSFKLVTDKKSKYIISIGYWDSKWYFTATEYLGTGTITYVNNKNDKNFTTPKAYVYCTGEAKLTGGWPGKAMVPNNDGTYSLSGVNIGKDTKVIISDNGASQIPDQSISGDIVIDGNGTANNQSISMNSYGMGTFCSAYPLDFSTASPSGLTAYRITESNKATGALTKDPVTKVPAGVGVYIEGAENQEYSVSPTATATSIGTNRLVGVTSDTNISQTDGENTNYILTVNTKNGDVATPKFYKVNSGGNKVLANRAYLQIPTVLASRESFWFEDGEATTIESAKQEQSLNGVAYNLAGQRIAQPTKGLYIVNGKKIIMK